MRSLGEGLEKSLRLHREHVAIEYTPDSGPGSHALTYGGLDHWSADVCDALRARGVGPGDRVALMLPNCPEYLVCAVAVARLGAAKLPVNPVLAPATIRYMLELGDAKVLVVGPGLAEKAKAALDGLDIAVLQTVPGIDGADPLPEAPAQNGPHRTIAAPVDPDLPAVVQFTGGTTGRPKGVLATQQGTRDFHLAQLIEGEIRRQERMLLMTPVSHAAGAFAETGLLRGATILLHESFDAGRTVHSLRHAGVTWTFLVPTMLYRILDALPPELRDRAAGLALDTVVYGAAPISPRRLAEALAVFGPVFVQLYGQSECPNWGTRLAKGDHDPARPGLLASCGRASFFVDVRIVDDEGRDLPTGETGEICLRSPYLMHSYVKDPDATAAKFLAGPGGDRWIRTGDLGAMDGDGFVYLKDRKADMVITGGMNVYSREVEDVLTKHPLVRAAAVIGVPHEDWGEAVQALVVAEDAVTGDELKAWCRERLSAYAVPKRFEFVGGFPETPYGKIDKKALRAAYWKDADRAIN
ncbi:AMP-binding protein [Acrocarpospora catenulata]|uniref:AMP-binding protein n=1 Tax=Acrocarpospora catenulata TaxID=2836182 RepID=UPI001BD98329|nr:AMP-binding protein [Acrocarpospora catenulata]